MFSLIEKAYAVETDLGQVNNVTDYVNVILHWVIPVVGALAVLMIVYAGYIYMTSQGNPERLNVAKDILIGVITGIALLFLIGIILRTVGTIP